MNVVLTEIRLEEPLIEELSHTKEEIQGIPSSVVEMTCDCSTCESSGGKVEALAVTRSQKLKSPLDWQEQKERLTVLMPGDTLRLSIP